MANLLKLRGTKQHSTRRARMISAVCGAALLLCVLSLRRTGQANDAAADRPVAAVKLTAAAVTQPAAAAAVQEPIAAQGADPAAGAAGGAAAAAQPGRGTGGEDAHTGYWFEVPVGEGQAPARMELLNEPVPEDCHLEENADYDGPALTWGMSFRKASASQCCQACKQRKEPQADGMRCNVWVWCGSRSGECWSPDIHNHTTGECWLKYQEAWDGSLDLDTTNLKVNARGMYSPAFRQEHKTAPEMVPWTAGVIV